MTTGAILLLMQRLAIADTATSDFLGVPPGDVTTGEHPRNHLAFCAAPAGAAAGARRRARKRAAALRGGR